MIQPAEDASSDRGTDDNRTIPVIIGPVADFGRFADNLVRRRQHEIGILHFGDRLHPVHCRPDGYTGNRRLSQRRIHDTLFTELFLQPLGGGEYPAFDADILAEYEH
ncbi:hypothetical protein D3C73_1357220 [compost metagenome]